MENKNKYQSNRGSSQENNKNVNNNNISNNNKNNNSDYSTQNDNTPQNNSGGKWKQAGKNNPQKSLFNNEKGSENNFPKGTSLNKQENPTGEDNHGKDLLKGMKKGAHPDDKKVAENQKKIERASKLVQKAPLPPQVKAAAKVAEKAKKSPVGKLLGNKILGGGGGLLGDDEEGPSSVVIAVIRRKIIMTLLPFIVLIFIVLMFVIIMSDQLGGSSSSHYSGGLCAYDKDYLEEQGVKKELANQCDKVKKDAKDFYTRLKEVTEEYKNNDKEIKPEYIVAFYQVVSTAKNTNLKYKDMTKDVIRELADSMLDKDGNFSEDTYKKNLIKKILPKYVKKEETKGYYKKLASSIIKYVEDFKKIFNINDEEEETEPGSGACTYDLKGVSPQKGVNIKLNYKITDLHVKLLECSSSKAISGEELVPFEDYVLGVVFGEIGSSYPTEAIKTQLVAARSYALARPAGMGNKNGLKLGKEKGKWILSLRNCVSDQVYCNPDKGCSSASSSCGDSSTVHSGHGYATKCLGGQKLAANDKMRNIAASVNGQVLVNAKDYVVNSAYVNTEQEYFRDQAKKGLDYKQILIQKYGRMPGRRNVAATGIKQMNCDEGSANGKSGPYAKWKQYDTRWANIHLGKSTETIKSAGCLATSISMLIAKSKTKTSVKGEFNPGSFVKKLNDNNGFNGKGCINWQAIKSAAPNFEMAKEVGLSGNKSQKAKQIKEALKDGCYPVISLRDQHWVAVESVSGNNVTMLDPGSTATNLWSKYPVSNATKMVCFKAK